VPESGTVFTDPGRTPGVMESPGVTQSQFLVSRPGNPRLTPGVSEPDRSALGSCSLTPGVSPG